MIPAEGAASRPIPASESMGQPRQPGAATSPLGADAVAAQAAEHAKYTPTSRNLGGQRAAIAPGDGGTSDIMASAMGGGSRTASSGASAAETSAGAVDPDSAHGLTNAVAVPQSDLVRTTADVTTGTRSNGESYQQVPVLTDSILTPRFVDVEKQPRNSELFVGVNITAADITEVTVDPEYPQGTPEHIKRGREDRTEKYSQMWQAGEGQTVVHLIQQGQVHVVTIGEDHTNTPYIAPSASDDSDIASQSGIIEGATGNLYNPAGIEAAINDACDVWATVRYVCAPAVNKKNSAAESDQQDPATNLTGNLADALASLKNVNAVAATRLIALKPEDGTLTQIKDGLKSLSVDISAFDDTATDQLKDQLRVGHEEVDTAKELGAFEMVTAVGIQVPEGLTADQAKVYIRRTLETVATRVAAANTTERAYRIEIVRDGNRQIVKSTTANEALARIPGLSSIVSTPAVADLMEIIPRHESSNIHFKEKNIFDVFNEEERLDGPFIELGNILDANGNPTALMRFRVANFSRGIYIGGNPGSGKTVAEKRLLAGAVENGINIVGVAPEKGTDLYTMGALLNQRWERKMLQNASREQIEAANYYIITQLTNPAISVADRIKLINYYKTVMPANHQIPELVVLPDHPEQAMGLLTKRVRSGEMLGVKDVLHPFSWRQKGREGVPEEWNPPRFYVIDFEPNSEAVSWRMTRPPEGVSIKDHIAALTEMYASSYDGDPEGRLVLETYFPLALLRAYIKCGIIPGLNQSKYPGGIDRYPTWDDIAREGLEEIRTGSDVSGVSAEGVEYSEIHKASIGKFWIGALSRIMKGNAGMLLNSKKPELDENRVELANLLLNIADWNEKEQGFATRMLAYMLTKRKEYRQKDPGYTSKDLVPLIFFIDEAAKILKRLPPEMVSTAAAQLAEMFATGRSKGLWPLIVSQLPGKVVKEAPLLAGSRLVFRLSDEESREELLTAQGVSKQDQRGQLKIKKAGVFDQFVASTSQPANDGPLLQQLFDPRALGEPEDISQVLQPGALTNDEAPPTNRMFEIAELFFDDNKREARALKIWASLICLSEAEKLKHNRSAEADKLRAFGWSEQDVQTYLQRNGVSEATMPITIPANIMKVLQDTARENPRQLRTILKMAASETADARSYVLLNPVAKDKTITGNTRDQMAEKIYRIMHNTIATWGHEPGTAIMDLLPALQVDLTASPYQYAEGLYLMRKMIAHNKERASTETIPAIQEFKARGLLPSWLDDNLTVVQIEQELINYQRTEMAKANNVGDSGHGGWLLGAEADGKGDWFEQGIGKRWYENGFIEQMAKDIRKFISDPIEAQLLIDEISYHIQTRQDDRRKTALKSARFALENWLALYGKEYTKRKDAAEAKGETVTEQDEFDLPYPYRHKLDEDGLTDLEGITAFDLLASVYRKLHELEPQTRDPLTEEQRADAAQITEEVSQRNTEVGLRLQELAKAEQTN